MKTAHIEIHGEDRHDWIYTTAYVDDKAVATVKRRSVIGDQNWTTPFRAWTQDGRQHQALTLAALKRKLARHLTP